MVDVAFEAPLEDVDTAMNIKTVIAMVTKFLFFNSFYLFSFDDTNLRPPFCLKF
jgi:hypothetical protein